MMQDLPDLIGEQISLLRRHPLCDWLADPGVPPGQRIAVLPAIAPLALGAASAYTHAVAYRAPRTDLQRALSMLACDAAAHASLFPGDWAALGLDGLTGWTASDTLWWVTLAAESAAARRAAATLLAMPARDHGDPVLRFAWAQPLHAGIGVLLSALDSARAGMTASTGREYRYLAGDRLGRGIQGGDLTRLFTGQVLTARQRAAAEVITHDTFAVLTAVFSEAFTYVLAYPAQGRVPQRAALERPGAQALLPIRDPRPDGPPGPDAQALLLSQYADQAYSHPLCQWLRTARAVPPAERLAAALPPWAAHVLGQHELYAALAQPVGEDFSAWAAALAAQAPAYLADWQALDLDSRPGWTPSQTLHWLYFDPVTAPGRRLNASLYRAAASVARPGLMWVLDMAQASTEPLLATTSALAGEAAHRGAPPLVYLSGLCTPPVPEGGRFRRAPLGPEDQRQIPALIKELAASSQAHLDIAALPVIAGLAAPERRTAPPGTHPALAAAGPGDHPAGGPPPQP